MVTPTTHPLQVQPHLLQKAITVIRAINHKLRLRMLQLMHQSGSISVSELYRGLHLPQAVASQHLAVLRRAGFVHTRRKGRHVYYSVNYERLHEAENLCRQLIQKKLTATDLLKGRD